MPRKWLHRAALPALLAAGVCALADSHVRIVRISFLAHRVEVLHPPADSDGGASVSPRWTAALLNAPVVENERIRTGAEGQVEIQLECGSALRLAPNSELTVSALRLRDDGVRTTRIALTAGEGYFTVRRADSPDFHLGVGEGAVATPVGAASLRVTASVSGPSTVELLDGHAQVQDGKQLIPLRKSAALQLRPGGMVAWVAAAAPDTWQQWSHHRDQLFQRAMLESAPVPEMDATQDAPPRPPPPPASGATAATAQLNNAAGIFAELDAQAHANDPYYSAGSSNPHRLVPSCANN